MSRRRSAHPGGRREGGDVFHFEGVTTRRHRSVAKRMSRKVREVSPVRFPAGSAISRAGGSSLGTSTERAGRGGDSREVGGRCRVAFPAPGDVQEVSGPSLLPEAFDVVPSPGLEGDGRGGAGRIGFGESVAAGDLLGDGNQVGRLIVAAAGTAGSYRHRRRRSGNRRRPGESGIPRSVRHSRRDGHRDRPGGCRTGRCSW